MGPIGQLVSMIPGMGDMAKDAQDAVDRGDLRRTEAIIRSMTRDERRDPAILTGSRRRRIATGSGTSLTDVNRLVKQFSGDAAHDEADRRRPRTRPARRHVDRAAIRRGDMTDDQTQRIEPVPPGDGTPATPADAAAAPPAIRRPWRRRRLRGFCGPGGCGCRGGGAGDRVAGRGVDRADRAGRRRVRPQPDALGPRAPALPGSPSRRASRVVLVFGAPSSAGGAQVHPGRRRVRRRGRAWTSPATRCRSSATCSRTSRASRTSRRCPTRSTRRCRSSSRTCRAPAPIYTTDIKPSSTDPRSSASSPSQDMDDQPGPEDLIVVATTNGAALRDDLRRADAHQRDLQRPAAVARQ